jgi:TM2 domain-containing membrane protein YozV
MAKEMMCEGKPGMGILAAALMAVGIYFLIWGFMTQMASAISWSLWNWNALLYYLIGFLVLGLGKMLKHKGHGMMHR